MTKRLLRILLALILCVSLCLSMAAPAFAAFGDVGFTNSETYLRTSYNENNYIELSISGNTLTVRGKLLLDGLTGVLVECGNVQAHKSISSGTSFTLRLTLNHSGYQSVDIFTGLGSSSTYWSYTHDRICIEKTDMGYRIMPSLFQKDNILFEQIEIDPNSTLSVNIPASVVAKSNEIVGSETDDYTKIFLLHKWVAENIYYDYDALYGISSRIDDSAGVLEARRAVCAGYSYLLRDLILAQGIPAMYCSNLSTHSSYALDTYSGESHAHTEAFVDGRWIIMDSTWDSRNEYRSGKYTAKTPDGYCYFDITSELFAMDHRIISRGGIDSLTDANGFRIRIWDGSLVGYEGKGGMVVIPRNVTNIESFAFEGCTNITSVVIPDSVTSIGRSAFWGCTALKSVTIPASITSIDSGAFRNCRSLTTVYGQPGSYVETWAKANNLSFLPSGTYPELNGITCSGWAQAEVITAIRAGIVPGDLPSEYTQGITRAQFCRIAAALYESMTGNTIEITASFLDTDDIYVLKMASIGVVYGVGDGQFKPDDTLKRDQAATILARLAESMGNKLTVVPTPFTDVPTNWATDSIAKIYGIGVMQGTGSGTTFTPLGTYTIEQSILTALRLMNSMSN